MQVEQHEILNGLTKYGYSGIDDGSKVHYLLGGIKTKHLDPVKVQITASPGLRKDYQGCVNLSRTTSPDTFQTSVITMYPKLDRVRKTAEVSAVEVAGYRLAMSPSPASRLMTAITPPKSTLRLTPSRRRSSRPSATSAGTSLIRRRSEEEVRMTTSWIDLGDKFLNSSPPSQERKEKTPKVTPMTLMTSRA